VAVALVVAGVVADAGVVAAPTGTVAALVVDALGVDAASPPHAPSGPSRAPSPATIVVGRRRCIPEKLGVHVRSVDRCEAR
jgi:hypothetical protein